MAASVTTGELAERRLLQATEIGSLAAALAGLFAGVGWATERHLLASLRPEYIPMAPSTALAFLLLGAALFCRAYFNSAPFTRNFGIVAVALVLLQSGLSLLGFALDAPLGLEVESHLVHAPGMFGAVSAGRMSPIAALSFVVVSIAILLLLKNRDRERAASLASICASVALTGYLVVLLGYLYGMPLLYGGKVIPVALTTTLAFLFLSGGIIAASGANHFPLRPFAGTSARALLLRAFLPVTVVVVLANGILYNVVPGHIRLNHALLGALSALLSAFVISLVVSRTAGVIGDKIDLAERERMEAEEGLRAERAELETRVQARTSELANINDALQAQVRERQEAEHALRGIRSPVSFPRRKSAPEYFSQGSRGPIYVRKRAILPCSGRSHGGFDGQNRFRFVSPRTGAEVSPGRYGRDGIGADVRDHGSASDAGRRKDVCAGA